MTLDAVGLLVGSGPQGQVRLVCSKSRVFKIFSTGAEPLPF